MITHRMEEEREMYVSSRFSFIELKNGIIHLIFKLSEITSIEL
jgi:hypothetical protein